MSASRVLAILSAAIALAAGCSKEGSSDAPAYKGPRVELRLGWPAGTYAFTMTTTSLQQVRAGGRQDAVSLWQQLDGLALVRQAKSGGRTIEMQYLHVRQSLTGGGPAMTFDSSLGDDAPAQSPRLSSVLRPLAGAAVTVTMDADGHVKSVSGLARLRGQLDPQAASVPVSGPSLAGVGEALAGLTDESVRDVLDLAWLLPARPVVPGDRWQATRQLNMPLLGPIKAQYQCVLEGISTGEGRTAAIAVWAQFTGKAPAETGGDSEGAAGVRLSQKGTVRFDIDAGMIVSLNISQTGTMVLPGDGEQRTTLTGNTDVEVTWRRQ